MADRNVKKVRRARGTRPRRTATASREAILDAAERLLRQRGPEALRLQRIAAAAGISHPLILHHFHSRDRLVAALAERALKGFGGELARALGAPAGTTILEGIEVFWRVFGEERYAQLFAWLVLSGKMSIGPPDMQQFAEILHAARERSDLASGRATPPIDDTRFAMVLMAVALFGDALIGRLVRRRLGLRADATTDRRFRVWLANLLEHGRAGVPQRWDGSAKA